MPKISQEKKDKISEQVLHYLFTISPESKFTVDVADSIVRDEEFTKVLLTDLQKKGLVVLVSKNPKGTDYLKRQRWRLSNQAFEVYKKHQNTIQSQQTLNSNSFSDI